MSTDLAKHATPHELPLKSGDGEVGDVTDIACFQLARSRRGVMPN